MFNSKNSNILISNFNSLLKPDESLEDDDDHSENQNEVSASLTHASIDNLQITPSFYSDVENFSSILLKTLNNHGPHFERVLLISK